MTLTIEWGWWLAPFAVTVLMFIVANRITRDIGGGGDYSFAGFFAGLYYMIVWVLPSLVAWLIWALVR